MVIRNCVVLGGFEEFLEFEYIQKATDSNFMHKTSLIAEM